MFLIIDLIASLTSGHIQRQEAWQRCQPGQHRPYPAPAWLDPPPGGVPAHHMQGLL